MFRWGLGNIHAYTLLKEPPAAQEETGHLPRSIFLTEFYLPNLHYQDCRIIFINRGSFKSFCLILPICGDVCICENESIMGDAGERCELDAGLVI